MPAEKLSPLEIALQEYVYWRDVHLPVDPSDLSYREREYMAIGAIGAAANIVQRLSGMEIERPYRALTHADRITLLSELRLAPKILAVFTPLVSAYIAGDIDEVMLEWIETRDWNALYKLIGELADLRRQTCQ